MAGRSRAQKIGARGHKWLAAKIESSPDWLSRDLGEDYGIDLEAELTENGVRGEILKIQIKSVTAVERRSGEIRLLIEKRYLDYAQSCRYPVILVLVDVEGEQAWYVWLQDWLIRHQASEGVVNLLQQSWTTWISDQDSIERGLAGELRSIAAWKGETQLVLSIMDALRSAAATVNYALIDALTEIVTTTGDSYSDAALAAIIGEAIVLGDRMRGTIEGLGTSRILFALVRKLGHRMTQTAVHQMVVRSDSYSRTGLTALGILYDEFPDHLSSLGLAKHFTKVEPRVAYYCAFREAFPKVHSANPFIDPGDFSFAGLVYRQPEGFGNKYATRGPSALLDYLEFPAGQMPLTDS